MASVPIASPGFSGSDSLLGVSSGASLSSRASGRQAVSYSYHLNRDFPNIKILSNLIDYRLLIIFSIIALAAIGLAVYSSIQLVRGNSTLLYGSLLAFSLCIGIFVGMKIRRVVA